MTEADAENDFRSLVVCCAQEGVLVCLFSPDSAAVCDVIFPYCRIGVNRLRREADATTLLRQQYNRRSSQGNLQACQVRRSGIGTLQQGFCRVANACRPRFIHKIRQTTVTTKVGEWAARRGRLCEELQCLLSSCSAHLTFHSTIYKEKLSEIDF